MNVTWQDLIAVGIVTLAAGYLGRTVYRMLFAGKSACGGCGTCPAADSKTPPLVSLDMTSKTPSTAKPTTPGQRH
jgi:FeoB-associated Cys-rich membrane protein